MKSCAVTIMLSMLLALGCAPTGRVRTLDGRKMSKELTAEFDLSGKGGQAQDSTWDVLVAEVDGVSSPQLFHGSERQPVKVDTLSDIPVFLEVQVSEGAYCDWIGIAGKIYLAPGKHIVKANCYGMIEGRGRLACLISSRIPLSLKCLAGHRYWLRAAIVVDKWNVWIEDKDTKDTVATTAQVLQ